MGKPDHWGQHRFTGSWAAFKWKWPEQRLLLNSISWLQMLCDHTCPKLLLLWLPPWWNCDLKVKARTNPSFLSAFVRILCHSIRKGTRIESNQKQRKQDHPQRPTAGDLLPGARNHLLKAPRAGGQTPRHKLTGDMSDSDHSRYDTLTHVYHLYDIYITVLLYNGFLLFANKQHIVSVRIWKKKTHHLKHHCKRADCPVK